MTELERIEGNTNGEIPESEYDIVKIKNIVNPEKELEIFKQTIRVFLENQNLNEEDSKWEELLHPNIVAFTEQLKDEDYGDELVSHIPAMIDNLKDIKDWEWFSSNLTENGFEVIMQGMFRGVFLPLLHHQGIPLKSLFIFREGTEYPVIRSGIDVLLYRTWNFDTKVLSKREKSWKDIRAPFMPKY